jgi:hypothetical protein
MVTKYDELSRSLLQALQLLWDTPHGNQRCAANLADLVFIGLPDIDQEKCFSAIQAALDIRGCNLDWCSHQIRP